MSYALSELAQRFRLELKGEGATRVEGVCALEPGRAGCLGFYARARPSNALATTQASALVLRPERARDFAGPALLTAQPELAFARIAALFDPHPVARAGVHPSAVVEAGARIHPSASIGPGCVIGAGAVIGEATLLVARVSIADGVRIGARCRLEAGAVIGSRGFGNVPTPEGWVAMPQLGSVVIGDDVEIGANTCIDRGALDDTVIEDGVKIDNLVQIAHNVRIGRHTAIAACVGIAGSTVIGSRCLIGGAAGINGHIRLGDGVIVAAGSMVTKSLPGPGQYAGPLPAMPARQWRRQIAGLRRWSRNGSDTSGDPDDES